MKLSSHSKQSSGEAKWQVTRHKESKTCEGEKPEKKNNFKDRYIGHIINWVGKHSRSIWYMCLKIEN